MTLKSYEAIYDHGKLIWKDAAPDDGPLHLIVTVLPERVGESNYLNGIAGAYGDDEPEYTEADIKWRYMTVQRVGEKT